MLLASVVTTTRQSVAVASFRPVAVVCQACTAAQRVCMLGPRGVSVVAAAAANVGARKRHNTSHPL